MSDSHGRGAITQQAVAALLSHGAQVLVHLGDIETIDVLDALAVAGADGQQLPVHVVFGNVDWDHDRLGRYAESIGLQVNHPIGYLPFEGGEVGFTHGHDQGLIHEAIDRSVAYLCHGHTHRQRDERIAGIRMINPGALFRAREYSAAILRPETDELTFLRIGEQ